jgi:hypothetical protein
VCWEVGDSAILMSSFARPRKGLSRREGYSQSRRVAPDLLLGFLGPLKRIPKSQKVGVRWHQVMGKISRLKRQLRHARSHSGAREHFHPNPHALIQRLW